MIRTDSEVWRYVDGELPPADADAIEVQAARDPVLQKRIDEARLMRAAVLEGAPRPPAGFAAKVAARAQLRAAQPTQQVLAVRQVLATQQVLEMRRFLRRVLVAAAILAAVGIAYMAIEVVPDLVDGLTAGSDPLLERR